jgi:outer membrane protein
MRLLAALPLACWLAGVLSAPAVGQERLQLTAEESVRRALAHDRRIGAAGAELEAAEARERQARAALLPAIRAQASATRLGNDIGEVEIDLPGLEEPLRIFPITRDRYLLEGSVEQILFAGGRLRRELEAAGAGVEAVALEGDQEAAQVAFEARRAYWSLHQALALREAVAASVALVEEHLRAVGRRVDEGTALTSELLAARTRRSEVRLEAVEADNAVRVARLELNRRLGLPLDAEVVTAPELEGGALGEAPGVTAADPVTTPGLEALEAQARALELQARAAEGARWPQVSLFGRYLYARPNPFLVLEQEEFQGIWEVGLTAQWSLWEGGRRRARISETQARAEAAGLRLVELREGHQVEVARLELEARRAVEARAVARETVAAAEEALRVARRQFAEGVAVSAQVLEAEEALRHARARVARSLADLALAHAALLLAHGAVW